MKKITIQIGTGCPTGTTKQHTKYTEVRIPEELVVDFCEFIHNYAHAQSEADWWQLEGEE